MSKSIFLPLTSVIPSISVLKKIKTVQYTVQLFMNTRHSSEGMSFSTAQLRRGRWVHSLHLRQLQRSSRGGKHTPSVSEQLKAATLLSLRFISASGQINFSSLTFSGGAVKKLEVHITATLALNFHRITTFVSFEWRVFFCLVG